MWSHVFWVYISSADAHMPDAPCSVFNRENYRIERRQWTTNVDDHPPRRTRLWNFHYHFPSKRTDCSCNLHHGSSLYLGRNPRPTIARLSRSLRTRCLFSLSLEAPFACPFSPLTQTHTRHVIRVAQHCQVKKLSLCSESRHAHVAARSNCACAAGTDR